MGAKPRNQPVAAKAKPAAAKASKAKAARPAAKAAKPAVKTKAKAKAKAKAKPAKARPAAAKKPRGPISADRVGWLDSDDAPALDAQLAQIEHFTESLADGVVDNDELEKQEQNLVAAMKAVEPELDDDTHGKVTRLLAELTAYNVMNVLHGMAVERARSAFSS